MVGRKHCSAWGSEQRLKEISPNDHSWTGGSMTRHGTLDSARLDSVSLVYEFSNRKIGQRPVQIVKGWTE